MGQATSASAQARPARTQRYSPWLRLRAAFYGRATRLFEALIGLTLLLLVVLGMWAGHSSPRVVSTLWRALPSMRTTH